MVDSFDANKTYQRLMHKMASSSSELMPEINKDLETLIMVHERSHIHDDELYYMGKIFTEANQNFNKIKSDDCSKYYVRIGLYVKVQKYKTEYPEPMRSMLDKRSQVILLETWCKLVKKGYYEYVNLDYPNLKRSEDHIDLSENSELIPDEPMSSDNGIWYVVIRGRQPGIYNSWERAQEQVLGYSNNFHKRFKDFKSAENYYRKNQSLETHNQK